MYYYYFNCAPRTPRTRPRESLKPAVWYFLRTYVYNIMLLLCVVCAADPPRWTCCLLVAYLFPLDTDEYSLVPRRCSLHQTVCRFSIADGEKSNGKNKQKSIPLSGEFSRRNINKRRAKQNLRSSVRRPLPPSFYILYACF